MSIPEAISEYQSREAMEVRALLPRFIQWLEAAGVLVQDSTNEYEVLRYRSVPAPAPATKVHVRAEGEKPKADKPKARSSVIYRRKDGTISWMGDALTHWSVFRSGGVMPEQPEITAPKKQRSWTERTRTALLERDGGDCYFCGKTMQFDHEGRPTKTGKPDVTIEHLIGQHFARTEGLEVNHLDNLVLAHAKCNRDIGHRPVSEKVTYREIMHDRRTTMWTHPEVPTPRERTR